MTGEWTTLVVGNRIDRSRIYVNQATLMHTTPRDKCRTMFTSRKPRGTAPTVVPSLPMSAAAAADDDDDDDGFGDKRNASEMDRQLTLVAFRLLTEGVCDLLDM